MATRVNVDDLLWAATWMDAYEATPGEDDDIAERCTRVSAWLRREAEARADAADIRRLARQTGATPAQARDALRRVRTST